MINFRELFNSKYSYIMLGIILVLFVIITIINNKDYRRSIKVISNILIISGVICIIIYLLVIFVLNISLFDNYKVFIQVISNTFNKDLLIRSIILLIIGIILKIVNSYLLRSIMWYKSIIN